MLIDCQVTFCIPGSDLFVAGRSGNGAVEDTIRLCRFMYENLGLITEISATMDTHTAAQIFHPVFWVNDAGEDPQPHTEISVEEVERGVWRVNPALAGSPSGLSAEALQQHALHYVRKLAEGGKCALIIWPRPPVLRPALRPPAAAPVGSRARAARSRDAATRRDFGKLVAVTKRAALRAPTIPIAGGALSAHRYALSSKHPCPSQRSVSPRCLTSPSATMA